MQRGTQIRLGATLQRRELARSFASEELACFVYVLATESFSCRSWVTESVTKCGKSGDWEQ
jgi:hypothetical protein